MSQTAYRTSMLLILGLLLLSCKTKKNSGEDHLSASRENCYPHRKVVQAFIDEPGLIIRLGDHFIITDLSGQRRLQPCSIASNYQVDSLGILFSGDQLEVNPGERRFANPLRLHKLQRQNTAIK